MLKSRLVVIVLSIIILYLYIQLVVSPFINGYDYFVEFAANIINKEQRADAIRIAFPKERFLIVQGVVIAVGIILSVLLVTAVKYVTTLQHYLFKTLLPIRHSWVNNIRILKGVSPTAKVIFCLALFYLTARSIWYMAHLPFIHDEAYTISNFVIPGPLVSITFYPYPNNHILFSLFSYPFSFLPLKPEISFRLPSLIAIIATCVVLFRILLLFFPAIAASLAVAAFVCTVPVTTYAVFARGYCLVFLFTSLAILSLIKAIEKDSQYHHILLIIFSVLGLFTVPSYLYPFAAIYTVYFSYSIYIGHKKVIRNSIISGLICFIFTLLLYLPVVITSGGLHAFIKIIYFGYDDSASFSKIWDFINFVYSIQFFEQNILVVIFLSLTVIMALISIKKIASGNVALIEKLFFWICLLGFFAPLISFLLQRKLVPPRTHSYVAIFFIGYAFLSLKFSLPDKWKQYGYISFTAFMIAFAVAFTPESMLLTGEAYTDKSADLFVNTMLQASNQKDTCYTFDMFYLADIQLKYALSKRQLTVYQNTPGSPSSAAFDYKNNYNWIITVNDSNPLNKDSLASLYSPVFVRNDATLWKKK